jgi:transposase-like protein
MELTYQEVYHMNPIQARKRIVHIYQQTQNYCETARRCHTSPQLVRKWVQRYQQYGEQGLHDLPKTPKRQPRKTDPDIEQRVLQLHQKPTTDASVLPDTSPNKAFPFPLTPSDTS